MKRSISDKAISVADLLEQIASVNEMISIHADDAFMRGQYEYRRKEFMESLKSYLSDFNVTVADLAA